MTTAHKCNSRPDSDFRADIEEKLAAIREVLTRDVHEARTDVRTLKDWRHHVRVHPWLFCGGALALGFVLAPRHKRPSNTTTAKATEPPEIKQSADVGHARGKVAKAFFEATATTLAEQTAVYLAQHAFDALNHRDALGDVQHSAMADSEATKPIDTTELDGSQGQSAPPAADSATADWNTRLAELRSLAGRTMAAHPKQTLISAIAAGLLIGWMTKRK